MYIEMLRYEQVLKNVYFTDPYPFWNFKTNYLKPRLELCWDFKVIFTALTPTYKTHCFRNTLLDLTIWHNISLKLPKNSKFQFLVCKKQSSHSDVMTFKMVLIQLIMKKFAINELRWLIYIFENIKLTYTKLQNSFKLKTMDKRLWKFSKECVKVTYIYFWKH